MTPLNIGWEEFGRGKTVRRESGRILGWTQSTRDFSTHMGVKSHFKLLWKHCALLATLSIIQGLCWSLLRMRQLLRQAPKQAEVYCAQDNLSGRLKSTAHAPACQAGLGRPLRKMRWCWGMTWVLQKTWSWKAAEAHGNGTWRDAMRPQINSNLLGKQVTQDHHSSIPRTQKCWPESVCVTDVKKLKKFPDCPRLERQRQFRITKYHLISLPYLMIPY